MSGNTINPMSHEQNNAFAAIIQERLRQERKFPDQWPTELEWLAILAEEFGEVAHEIADVIDPTLDSEDDRRERLWSEVVQVAAVCVRWLEQMQ